MEDTMIIAQATVQAVLKDIQNEIRIIAKVYDSRDIFGISYLKFAEKINDIIDEYIEK